jgi:hypothetical protein
MSDDEVDMDEFDGDFDGDFDGGGTTSMDDAARSLLGGGRRPKAGAGDKAHGPMQRLYRGETRFDFVGRRKVWFTISTIVIVAGILSIILRGGLNLGIEFKGGTEWTVKAPNVTQVQATNAMQAATHRPVAGAGE